MYDGVVRVEIDIGMDLPCTVRTNGNNFNCALVQTSPLKGGESVACSLGLTPLEEYICTCLALDLTYDIDLLLMRACNMKRDDAT